MDSPADYLGGHPLDRDGSDADSYLSFDSPPVLPLPSGTYTLLPLVDACDNVQLPTGPWSGQECKRRWEAHLAKERNAFAEEDTTAAAGDSALADDDEEDDHEQGPAAFDKEFLVPFFVALPSPPPPPSSSSSGASLRRRSSAASGNGRPSFSRLTPLPRLRSSSPTPSTSSFVRARADPSAAPEGAPPIGFLRPQVVRALIEDNRKLVAMNCRPVWAFQPAIAFPPPARRPSYSSSRPGSRRSSINLTSNNGASPPQSSSDGERGVPMDEVLEGLRTLNLATSAETGPWAVGFEDWVNEEGIDARKEHVDRLVRGWKHAGMFSECLGGASRSSRSAGTASADPRSRVSPPVQAGATKSTRSTGPRLPLRQTATTTRSRRARTRRCEWSAARAPCSALRHLACTAPVRHARLSIACEREGMPADD